MYLFRRESSILGKIARRHKIECAVIAAVAMAGLLLFRYFDGMALTLNTISTWDTIFTGMDFREIELKNLATMHASMSYSGATFLITIPWSIWNFPLWVIHHCYNSFDYTCSAALIWSELFLIICAVIAGLISYHIIKFLTNDEEKAQLGAIFFWGSGTLFISIGYSMQDEILYILTFLLGFYAYLLDKRRSCLIWLIITVTLCPFMILPCLLITIFYTRNLCKLALSAVSMLIPYAMSTLLFPPIVPLKDDYFAWFFGRNIISIGIGNISIFAVVILLIYAYAYFKKFKNKEEECYTLIYLLAALMSTMCILSWLHFYRLFICLPFLLICILVSDTSRDEENVKIGLFILTAFEYCRTAGSFLFDENCMRPIFTKGFLHKQLSAGALSMSFSDVLGSFAPKLLERKGMVGSIIVAITIFLLIMLYRKSVALHPLHFPTKGISIIYVSCPALLIIAFTILSISVTGMNNSIQSDATLAPAITGQTSLDECYYSEGEKINNVQVRTVTWGRNYPDSLDLQLKVIQKKTGNIVGSATISANKLPNNDYCTFDFSGLKLDKGQWYTFRLSASEPVKNEKQAIYLLRSNDGTADISHHYGAVTENETSTILPYDVVTKITGHK